MSMNATVRSSARTIVAGISPATILQKMQSTRPVYWWTACPRATVGRGGLPAVASAAAPGVVTGIWLQTSLL